MDERYCIFVDGELKFVPLLVWAAWFEISENRRIAETFVGDVRISTVFLGFDQNLSGGSPLYFETMIFGGEHDEMQKRYGTLEESMQGHEQMVEMVSIN
jgi:hypothetical protein